MGFHIVCDEISFAGTAAVISHFKLERKQESIVTPAYWSYTQYSIMTAANSPTYEAFIGQARLNIRVLLVHIVPSPSYSTPRRSPGTPKAHTTSCDSANEYTVGSVRVEEKAILHAARDRVIDIVRPWARVDG